jgi:hypothetical protein
MLKFSKYIFFKEQFVVRESRFFWWNTSWDFRGDTTKKGEKNIIMCMLDDLRWLSGLFSIFFVLFYFFLFNILFCFSFSWSYWIVVSIFYWIAKFWFFITILNSWFNLLLDWWCSSHDHIQLFFQFSYWQHTIQKFHNTNNKDMKRHMLCVFSCPY